MLHLIWELFNPSNLDGYQVASQEILYVLFLLCTSLCSQQSKRRVVNLRVQISLYLFFLDFQTILSNERTKFDTEEKSSTFV
jgi:hypothetical protein